MHNYNSRTCTDMQPGHAARRKDMHNHNSRTCTDMQPGHAHMQPGHAARTCAHEDAGHAHQTCTRMQDMHMMQDMRTRHARGCRTCTCALLAHCWVLPFLSLAPQQCTKPPPIQHTPQLCNKPPTMDSFNFYKHAA